MRAARKVKVSLTLSPALLDHVDREARRSGMTRSYLIEQWLRSGANRAAEQAYDAELIAYYTSMTPAQRAEDEAIARASSRAARRINYDEPQPTRRKKRR